MGVRYPSTALPSIIGEAAVDRIGRAKSCSGPFEKQFAVYFCSPLDLDFAMLAAFPADYEALVPERGKSAVARDRQSRI